VKAFCIFLLAFGSFAIADVAEKIQQSSSLIERGDLEGARKLLREALAENPQNGAANLLLGQIAMQQFQWEEAEERLKAATTLPTRRPHLPWQLLGRLFLLKHNYTLALNAFNQSLQQDPNFEPALLGRARARLFLNEVDDAISDLKQIKNMQEAQYLYAQILVYRNRIEEAKELLRKLAVSFPVGAWLLKSLEKGDEREAVAILSDNLGTSEAYFAAAMHYRGLGNLEMTQSSLKIAFQLDDQNPAPLLFLKTEVSKPALPHTELVHRISEMKALLDQKKLEDAHHAASRLIEACKRCVPAHLVLMDLLEKKRQFWEAVEEFESMDQWLPDLPVVLIRVADMERTMGAFRLAECTARRAISIDSANGSHYYQLARIQNEAKSFDAAIESSKKAIALGYENSTVYVLLGDLYYQKMELSQSMEAMEEAMILDPQSAERVASFALSELVTQNHPSLRAALEKNAEAHPESTNTVYALGVMYLNEQNLPKAKQYFERLQKLVPRNSQIYYNLALIYQREGNQAGAAGAMRRFRELKDVEQQEFNAANEAHRLRDQGQSALNARDSAKAISIFSKLVSSKFSEQKDLVSLAKAYQNQKDNENAYACYLKALAVLPADQDALTGAIESAGNKELAEKWRKRLKLLSKC
jgi:tetratricopeptide (TPR) repeat protein